MTGFESCFPAFPSFIKAGRNALFLVVLTMVFLSTTAHGDGAVVRDVGPLTANDLKFYFESIILKDGAPVITLSAHISGASWSHFSKEAPTGICAGKQVFRMARANRLDIIGKGFSMFINKSESANVLSVLLLIIPDPKFPEKTELRMSSLKADGDGKFEIAEVPVYM